MLATNENVDISSTYQLSSDLTILTRAVGIVTWSMISFYITIRLIVYWNSLSVICIAKDHVHHKKTNDIDVI